MYVCMYVCIYVCMCTVASIWIELLNAFLSISLSKFVRSFCQKLNE
ncbi:unnamed protein product [Spirodela intermedia]|uniref:Uncharacterized protein n=1 Tax=Spirodela intermedia TaxID=51605 RepID=A0A7I8IVH4_SPIIN|nr:unnamed protein product [Spirodela intermedia]CAA6661148.1 unnamed protein product [Spirodela intermedia]